MNENRRFFCDTVERILADTLTPADIEATGRRVLPVAAYDALASNGILTMLVPEEAGGIGASIADAVAILRAAGAAAMPGPLLETMLGQAMLASAGLDTVDGTIALVFAEQDASGVEPVLYDVRWGGVADHVLAVGARDGGTSLRLTPPTDWLVSPALDAADEPLDVLRTGSLPPASGVSAAPLADWLAMAAIMRGSQILGAVEWTLARSIEYAGERKQFGREIGKFQVIQQMLAELADHTLAAAGITEAAAESLSRTLVAAARSRLGDAADAAIAIGHQVHGALGFSREYALNHRTRRLMAWRDDFGSVLEWRRTLADGFAGCSREQFWPAIARSGVAQ